MLSRRQTLKFFALTGLMLTACEASGDRATLDTVDETLPDMNLTSTAFTANTAIPQKYTCDGQDLSPPLNWEAPPEGTQSLALIVDDPDAPIGTFVHWVVFDIPSDTRQIAEGRAPNGRFGKNDFGKQKYGGPCPPGGTHRYFFKLYALDTTLGLEAGVTKAKVLEAMEGHVLAQGELVGIYSRQR
ncbi:MAG: YbhB/YbcL family Raf kinase inhibitor-like protein [Baaleninema sp.]